jgi:DNA-directed RNA polymerase alpha subunit
MPINEPIPFDHACRSLGVEIQAIASSVREKLSQPWSEPPQALSAAQVSDLNANIELAYRHLEDAAMRLGEALQAWDGDAPGSIPGQGNESLKSGSMSGSRELSIFELVLSARAMHALNDRGITTVGELADKAEYEIRKYRNIGKKTLHEIRSALQALGLDFKGAKPGGNKSS